MSNDCFIVLYTHTHTTAVGASFLPVTYAVVENDTTVEVCVEIVTGVVGMEDTVEVETMSGTATGESGGTFKLQLFSGPVSCMKCMVK